MQNMFRISAKVCLFKCHYVQATAMLAYYDIVESSQNLRQERKWKKLKKDKTKRNISKLWTC